MTTDSSGKSSEATDSGERLPLAAVPWVTRAMACVLLKLRDKACRRNGTINRRLINIIDFKSPPTRKPDVKGISSSDVTIDPSRKLWFRLFTPTASTTASSSSLPLIVYFHGGGFATMSAASRPYDAFCRRLASELSAIVASVEYRLSPEHRFPSQYEDGFDALRFVAENSATLLPENADLSRCFLAGDSAGGNLAHHVVVRVAQSKLEGVKIRGLIAFQPFFGGTEQTESEIRNKKAPLLNVALADWFWRAFLPEGADRDHGAANVSGPNAVDISVLAEFPATMVIAGGMDPLHDWQVKYYEWLKRSGKEAELVYYPNMVHGFYGFPELLDATQLLSKVKDFVTRRSLNQMSE
ncbi:probable carboxylesterase 18 [Punica granatum]|uniref:Alpha/beta hydrolase fold-3 domain-containing protein n=2 Tax=Punica granatum TaxID=22663 RepID=A0A218WAC9_PUNGR|nr:probable carboxylesterase 18 [Punica granatum]OWM69439.1 hypothetical protein CDL15_Pgr013900 [Punica granatum]PKI72621.1 hypothetical protein CRG98_006998 [Punica granatum]